MQLISTEQFIEQAAKNGIILDPIYSAPKCLVYAKDATESRWWNIPKAGDELLRFFSHLLQSTEAWSSCYLWRRGGSWPNFHPPHNLLDEICIKVKVGQSIPDDYCGAVNYVFDEREHLLGQVTMHVKTGWCVQDDLFIIPDHGRFLIHTDHHGVVHVTTVEQAGMMQLIERMAVGGHNLPEEPLDWTFKRPAWM